MLGIRTVGGVTMIGENGFFEVLQWTDFVCWNLSGNQTENDLYYAALSRAQFDLNGARLEYFIDGAMTHLASGILFPFFISQQ